MTAKLTSRSISRILCGFLCIMLVFVLSSCGEEPEPEPVIQVPYYIGAVLYSSESESSQEYKDELERAFARLETETARYSVDFMYSGGDLLEQEHHVSYFIAQGVDAVFVEPVSSDSTLFVHDLIIDSGGTYGVFIGTDPEEGSLDEQYIFCWPDQTSAASEVSVAAEKINEILTYVPEPETEGEEGTETEGT